MHVILFRFLFSKRKKKLRPQIIFPPIPKYALQITVDSSQQVS